MIWIILQVIRDTIFAVAVMGAMTCAILIPAYLVFRLLDFLLRIKLILKTVGLMLLLFGIGVPIYCLTYIAFHPGSASISGIFMGLQLYSGMTLLGVSALYPDSKSD